MYYPIVIKQEWTYGSFTYNLKNKHENREYFLSYWLNELGGLASVW